MASSRCMQGRRQNGGKGQSRTTIPHYDDSIYRTTYIIDACTRPDLTVRNYCYSIIINIIISKTPYNYSAEEQNNKAEVERVMRCVFK